MPAATAVQLDSMKMDPSFLSRNVNEGFSGGEKKRNEILQLAVLEPDLAILDEIDSGLDVDALKDVAAAVNGMRCSPPVRSTRLIVRSTSLGPHSLSSQHCASFA
jgi:Fe-S cluster assembly ATPase SufC